MTRRKYPWEPGTYQAATGKQPGLETFYKLCKRRWGFSGFGTWIVRSMRDKPFLSVHATGAACDLGYGSKSKDRQKAVEACQWLVANNFKLGIVAIHDYAAAGAPRAWRCDRGTWQTFTAGELGPGGRWLHIELEPHMAAMNAATYEALWRSIPKP